jgi:hypothetical protein
MDLNQKIPAYITEKKNIVRLVFFTAIFALIFINLYSPFEVNTFFLKAASLLKLENQRLLLLISSSLIILTGVLVVVLSRIILFLITKKYGQIAIYQYLIWISGEVIFMALFYSVYERLFLKDPRPFTESAKISIQNTALVLLLPYSITWLYLSWNEKNRMLQKIREGDIQNVNRREMIVFHDEKGTMRLSIKFSELLYLQAADNYVYIVYSNLGKQSKYMLRSSLKIIEEAYKDFPLVRCHRSFIVNFDQVKIIRREKDGLKIVLDAPVENEIPVSNTYMEEVFKAFGHTTEKK